MILFISDLHLQADRPDLVQAFERFLQREARNAEALYILGDFFEAWVGDDDDDPFVEHILEQLKGLKDSGVPCYFLPGNRDFLAGPGFTQRTGCQLISESGLVDLYGRKALLMHGDSLCTGDTEYMQFRSMSRRPEWQAGLLAKSLQERRDIARQLRMQSKSMNALKAEDIMDVTPTEVDRVMAENGVNLLIHGHTHRPHTHSVTHGERIVLGDWDKTGWLLRATPARLSLEEFPIG